MPPSCAAEGPYLGRQGFAVCSLSAGHRGWHECRAPFGFKLVERREDVKLTSDGRIQWRNGQYTNQKE